MAKKVKFTEVTHQWEGRAIIREEGQLKDVNLGVAQSDKKLKETGAKELFKELPKGTITVEVVKLSDVIITYVADVEEFKKVAVVEDIPTEVYPSDEELVPTAE
ncbi:MAG: hypothetical protein K0S34_793 [Bacillales bacterium]|jgi:hypothetical protein|nr:hypothetical protein [Bacillales bacterium]